MFTVCVRDRFMVAHSFRGEVFGPAQRLHGATYVVDVELRRPELDADGVVVDIGRASAALRQVLADLEYRNLDDEPAFAGRNTTTEFLCRYVHEALAAKVRAQFGGRMRVTLRESPVAWTSYEADVVRAGPKAAGTSTAVWGDTCRDRARMWN